MRPDPQAVLGRRRQKATRIYQDPVHRKQDDDGKTAHRALEWWSRSNQPNAPSTDEGFFDHPIVDHRMVATAAPLDPGDESTWEAQVKKGATYSKRLRASWVQTGNL